MDFKSLSRKAYVVKQAEKQVDNPDIQVKHYEQLKHPDSIVIHSITTCSCCQTSLEKEPVLGRKKRQVFDLPALKIEVTQHEAEGKVCPNCLEFQEAAFPKDVNHPVQYGSRIQALVVYLINYQMLSYSRTAAFFRDQFGQSISEGTIVQHSSLVW